MWIALSAPNHVHHARARRYWDEESGGPARLLPRDRMALLRFLTNPRILGSTARPLGACSRPGWPSRASACSASPRASTSFSAAGVRSSTCAAGTGPKPRPEGTRAAFAAASGCRLVALDGDFRRYPAIAFLHLAP